MKVMVWCFVSKTLMLMTTWTLFSFTMAGTDTFVTIKLFLWSFLHNFMDFVPIGDGFCECLQPYGNWHQHCVLWWTAGILIEEKNWPPFLPILHHSIAKDIPLHTQRIQYFAYGSWLGTKLFILTASCDVIWIVSSDVVDSSMKLEGLFGICSCNLL